MFWKLGVLSDEQVLGGLARTLGSNRRLTAELVAHLGEVEERRLHLDAACGSMFSYCVSRLGLSEDEACRRIDVARLTRRFPAIFPLLATGELSLSVAALLKPHLTNDNASRLIAAVSSKSVQRAREVLATLFPRPDVPATVRKLPEPRARSVEDGLTLLGVGVRRGAASGASDVSTHAARDEGLRASPSPVLSIATAGSSADSPPASVSHRLWHEPAHGENAPHVSVEPTVPATRPIPDQTRHAPPGPRVVVKARIIEPLAASRYKVQFTANAELKAKLELAQDLMRHAVPDGDFAIIIGKALDRLIADVMSKRFGGRTTTREPGAASSSARGASQNEATKDGPSGDVGSSPVGESSPVPPAPSVGKAFAHAAAGTRVPHAVRRAVVERDGLRCSWVDDRGVRCEERAWLEYDHHHPRGKGGTSDVDNMRLLCRGHNRRAAELEYGREPVERAISSGRRRRARCVPEGMVPEA